MPSEVSEMFERLGANIIPINYHLTIRPNLKAFEFKGTVSIDLKVNEPSEFIELHSIDLCLKNIEFSSSDGNVLKFDRIQVVKEKDTVKIFFSEDIKTGRGKLTIEFSGQLNENLNGFYKTRCMNRNGTMGYAAVTQFEAVYARKAFPCFDEPEMKATFDIVVIAEESKTVLSNMPLKFSLPCPESNTQMFEFHFERTPIMSTYLVAYIIGEFDFAEEQDENGVLIRVYTPIGKSEMAQFSLDLSVKVLPFYTKYFDLKYPLPKLDLIAIEDVEIEAMENWGLIVFKEPLLLVDPNNFSIQTKAEVGLVVSHEIAHQWFGNIVTMEWWTHLWLNEGFATWIEYLSIDYCMPEWDIWNYYAVDHLMRAFELDSLENSHPIEVKVGNPDEINQIFDSISYCKGSSIIRMLNDYIGNADFVSGLQSYLKKFQYMNATTDDLWRELSVSSRKNIAELMETWTKHAGYPVIEVKKKINTENQHTILCLHQEKFLKVPDAGVSNKEDLVWKVPITLRTKSSYPSVLFRHLLDGKTCEIDCGVIPENDWILLNHDYTCFYRSKYSAEMFNQILNALEENPENVGSSLDRIGIVNDSFALTWSSNMCVTELMKLIWALRNEKDTYVWLILLKHLQPLSRCLLDTELTEDFGWFFKNLLKNVSSKLGFELKSTEDDQTLLLHEKILYSLARTDDDDFHLYAKKLYDNRSLKQIPANLQKSVYTSILRNGSQMTIEEFKDMYTKCYTPEEKERLIVILSEVNKDDLIESVLEFSISDTITKEETVFLLVAMAENSTSKLSLKTLWQFLKKNWKLIEGRYFDSVLLGRLLKPIIQNFTSNEDIEDIQEFFAKHPASSADKAIQQGIELLKAKIEWIASQKSNLRSYFNKNKF